MEPGSTGADSLHLMPDTQYKGCFIYDGPDLIAWEECDWSGYYLIRLLRRTGYTTANRKRKEREDGRISESQTTASVH